MRATKRQIIFFKSKVLAPIHTKLVEQGSIFSIDQTNQLLKEFADLDKFKSCKDMTRDEMGELIIWSFQYGDMINLRLNYPDNESDWD